LWCNKFGSEYAKRLKQKRRGFGDTFFIDEVFIKIKLGSYGVAQRELIPETIHDTSQYANNKAELSHQPTRVRERGMRKFKSMEQTQRFLSAHAEVFNLFNLGRHLLSAKNYRMLRDRAFVSWEKVVAV